MTIGIIALVVFTLFMTISVAVLDHKNKELKIALATEKAMCQFNMDRADRWHGDRQLLAKRLIAAREDLEATKAKLAMAQKLYKRAAAKITCDLTYMDRVINSDSSMKEEE